MKFHTLLLIGALVAVAPGPAFADFAFGAPMFAFNSAALDDRSRAILVDAAEILRRYPDYKLKLYGSRGQLESDSSISERRLSNAQVFLIKNGVPERRILVEDRGINAPVQPSCSQAESPSDCDRYNRNIQLQLVAP